jgi:hypothetical protein
MNDDKFKITWSRHEHEPQPVNVSYPEGTHVDLSQKRQPACTVSVPYPTRPELGLLRIKCGACGAYAILPTCGRLDDPRSVKLACRRRGRPDGLEAEEECRP